MGVWVWRSRLGGFAAPEKKEVKKRKENGVVPFGCFPVPRGWWSAGLVVCLRRRAALGVFRRLHLFRVRPVLFFAFSGCIPVAGVVFCLCLPGLAVASFALVAGLVFLFLFLLGVSWLSRFALAVGLPVVRRSALAAPASSALAALLSRLFGALFVRGVAARFRRRSGARPVLAPAAARRWPVPLSAPPAPLLPVGFSEVLPCFCSPSFCFSAVWPSPRGGWPLPRWSCRSTVLGHSCCCGLPVGGSVPGVAAFAFRCPGCVACRGGLPGGSLARGFGRWLVVRLGGFAGSGWFGLSEGFAVRPSGGFFFGTSTNRPGRRRNGCAQGLGSRHGTVSGLFLLLGL